MVHQRKCVSAVTDSLSKRSRRESEMCNVLHHGGQHLQLDQDFRFPLSVVPKMASASTTESGERSATMAEVNTLHVSRYQRHMRHHHYHHHHHHRRLHHHHHHHHHNVTITLPLAELMHTTSTNDFPQFTIFSLTELKEGDVERIMRDRCEDCVTSDMFSRFTDSHLRIHTSQSTLLHVACALPLGASWVKLLCAKGAKVNARNQHGQTPLHLVLLGDARNDRQNMADSLESLLHCGADVNAEDNEGDTPLHYLRTFLKKGHFSEATEVAKVLLQRGANPNAVNRQNRTLLTYSVSYLDDSISLSRLLLNYGAVVWCKKPAVELDADQSSSFNWFLKSVIQMRRLENCSLTLKLLSQVMGESPNRMHSHVLRIMFRHVRCFRVLGPVFLQLKLCMLRYWTQPHDLKYLCCKTLRRSMGPRRVNWATAHLGLPKSLQRYVLME